MSRRRYEEHLAYERRKKRTTILFSLFVVLTMVGAIFAAMLYNPSTQERMKYGEYKITVKQTPGGGSVYAMTVAGNDVELQNLPTTVTYLDVDSRVAPLLQNAQQIALVSETNASVDDLQLIDYARFQLAYGLITPAFSAMTGENPYGLPIMNCSVASAQMPVILFLPVNDTPSITLDDACITVTGTGRGLLAAKDRLLYERLGIIVNGAIVEE